MSRIILCVLSDLSPTKEEGKLPSTGFYACESADGEVSGEISYKGRQTNEAPVRFLLDSSREDVAEVLYLCSESCKNDKIFRLDDEAALQLMEEGFSLDSEGEKAGSANAPVGYRFTDSCLQISTERYFQESVLAFCRDKPIDNQPVLTPIAYDPGNPGLSIAEIVKHVRSDTTIDIDTTGGPRDAVLLMSLAVNVIFAQSSSGLGDSGTAESDSRGVGAKLGRTVYSDFGAKMIRSQNHAFGLFQLISAVQSFTRYGKADLLNVYFSRNAGAAENESRMHRGIRSLCRDMEEFSDSLSLCRAGGSIQNLIESIHEKLKRVEKDGEYAPGSDTGYLLFRSLAPTIRERFIPSQDELGGAATPKAQALQHIRIIRWCVERQMIQQALAIYKEGTPGCFLNAGFFKIEESGDGGYAIAAEVVKQLCIDNTASNQRQSYVDYDLANECVNALAGKEGGGLWNCRRDYDKREMALALRTCWPKLFVDTRYASVTPSGEAYLPLNLAIYSFVNSIRNAVMHVGNPVNTAVERFGRFIKVANARGKFDFVPLGTDIEMATISRLLNTAINVLEATIQAADERSAEDYRREVEEKYAFDDEDGERRRILEGVCFSVSKVRSRVEEYYQDHADDFVFATWDDLYPGSEVPYIKKGDDVLGPDQLVHECCAGVSREEFRFRVAPVVALKRGTEVYDGDEGDPFLCRIMEGIKSSRCCRSYDDGCTYVATGLVEGMPSKKELGLGKISLADGLCEKYPLYFERAGNAFCLM